MGPPAPQTEEPGGTAPTSGLVLLLAPPLLREPLVRLLTDGLPELVVSSEADGLPRRPDLLLLCLEGALDPVALGEELRRLQERWRPTPLLLRCPENCGIEADVLLSLPVQGVVQGGDPELLLEVIPTLLAGGRVVRLSETPGAASDRSGATADQGAPGRFLLLSGLCQLDGDLQVIEALLDPPPRHTLLRLLLEGRRRELRAARSWLLWFWGPLLMAWGVPEGLGPVPGAPRPEPGDAAPGSGLAITLPRRDAEGVWLTLMERLRLASQEGLRNATGQPMALEGLNASRRRDLMLALLMQLDLVLRRLRSDDPIEDDLSGRWRGLQPELAQAAVREMAGAYVRLPREGILQPVSSGLLAAERETAADPELDPTQAMLAPLVRAQPILVEGQLLPPDDPRALLHLEALLSNWLIRTAEAISAEILSVCGDWPELRRYLLQRELLATRSLERLRNRLNTRDRWYGLVQRPIQLYESRRELYQLRGGAIRPLTLTEPRDAELKRLRGLPQLVTLALEARDALAPQIQALLRRLGDVLVVLLTQVIGRGIGLIGRGILQGMGRSLGRG